MSPPTIVHLDVDGVLADWTAATCRLFDRDPEEVRASWPSGVWDLPEVLGVSTNEMWRRVDAAGADFWATLELFPWSLDLYELCCSLAPTTLLTSPSRHPSSLAGKLLWMQEHFGGRTFTSYLIGPDKAAAASPRSVLIDDRPAGLAKYQAAGGWGILFPAAQNNIGRVDDPIAWVEPLLRDLLGKPRA